MNSNFIKGFAGSREVYIKDVWLDPERSQKLRSHSPDGFNWGYTGSGPSQLSLAILLELMPQEAALNLYHRFKADIISKLDKDHDFNLPVSEVEAWIKEHTK